MSNLVLNSNFIEDDLIPTLKSKPSKLVPIKLVLLKAEMDKKMEHLCYLLNIKIDKSKPMSIFGIDFFRFESVNIKPFEIFSKEHKDVINAVLLENAYLYTFKFQDLFQKGLSYKCITKVKSAKDLIYLLEDEKYFEKQNA